MGQMINAATDFQRKNGAKDVGLGRYIAENGLGLAWLLGAFWYIG